MPALPNDQHEQLAQFIASGQSNADAWVNAGFRAKDKKVASSACWRLLKDQPAINERIGELKALARSAAFDGQFLATIDSMTQLYLQDREQAKQLGQVSAAISALNGVAKLHALGTETVKHQGDPNNPVVHELRRVIVDPGNSDSAGVQAASGAGQV